MQQSIIELGIILKTEPFKDNDVRCYILTPAGIKTVYATGARKATAKLKSAVQLFTIAEFSMMGNKLTGAHVLQIGTNIVRDINRYYLACSVCEVLLQLKNLDNQVFYLTARTIESLNESTSAYKIFINFFTKLLILLGYDIDIPDFKDTDNDKIDDIKLGLTDAKRYVKMICQSYTEHLDIKIPNSDIF